MQEFYTIKEVMGRVGCGIGVIYRYKKLGMVVPRNKIGKSWVYTEGDVQHIKEIYLSNLIERGFHDDWFGRKNVPRGTIRKTNTAYL